jgi:hypothetical protein
VIDTLVTRRRHFATGGPAASAIDGVIVKMLLPCINLRPGFRPKTPVVRTLTIFGTAVAFGSSQSALASAGCTAAMTANWWLDLNQQDLHQQDLDRGEQYECEMASLMGRIVARLNLAAAEPPHLQFVSKHRMSELYFGAKYVNNFDQLVAFYQPAKATIYLQDIWQANELRDQSVLLHELVYQLQDGNNINVSCPAALERQAYDLQFTWLREHRIKDPYEFVGTNVLIVILRTSCPE